jgi:hypothetical protein
MFHECDRQPSLLPLPAISTTLGTYIIEIFLVAYFNSALDCGVDYQE